MNVPPVKSAASDTPVSTAPVTKTETQTSSAPATACEARPTRLSTALSPDRVKELKQNDEIVQLLYIAEQYLGKTLTPTEMKKILFFYDELKFSPDLIEYLIEYSVSRGHKSMRYIETVALAWQMRESPLSPWQKRQIPVMPKNTLLFLNQWESADEIR